MVDKIIAPIAILMFLAFVAFLAIYVNSIDLWFVIVTVSAMALFDFWQTLRSPSNNGSN